MFCIIVGYSGSVSAVTIPLLINQSKGIAMLDVLKFSEEMRSTTSPAGTRVKLSTSPSLLLGMKVSGSSRSNTNSVLGWIPRSDWWKKETDPAGWSCRASSRGTLASSLASLMALSRTVTPSETAPPTKLSLRLGQVGLFDDLHVYHYNLKY